MYRVDNKCFEYYTMTKSLNTIKQKMEMKLYRKTLGKYQGKSMEHDKKRTGYATMFQTEIIHLTKTL